MCFCFLFIFLAALRNDKGILQSNTRRRLLSQYEARSATGADGGFGEVCTVATLGLL